METETDAKLHGVYSDRRTAICKALKVAAKNPDHGYFCILKKKIEGKTEKVTHMVCEEYGLDEFVIDNK